MGLYSRRWAWEDVQAAGGLSLQDQDSGSERSLPHTRALGEKTNVSEARAQQEQHCELVSILRIMKLHDGNDAVLMMPVSSM